MEFEDALKIPKDSPILLLNGRVGMVCRWYEDRRSVGITITGESGIFLLPAERIGSMGGGVYYEIAP